MHMLKLYIGYEKFRISKKNKISVAYYYITVNRDAKNINKDF